MREKIFQKLSTSQKKYADEVIVYDDGSTDDTFELATAAGATVIKSPKNKGYGWQYDPYFKRQKNKRQT